MNVVMICGMFRKESEFFQLKKYFKNIVDEVSIVVQ